jgi:hypothetical protein
MGFASGSVSFRRFAVLGKQPDLIDQDLLDKLSEHALRSSDLPQEEEYGWSGGRHILDGNFTFDHNVFGEALFFGLRIDTNKVPGELKKAYQIMEEEAAVAGNPSGFISKLQKRGVKDTVRRKVDDDLRSGQFRRSKLIPILWDLPSQTLYSSASGAALEKLMEIFERTFDLTLLPISAGSLSLRLLEPRGRRRDYEDLRPSRFTAGPEGEEQYPEYPWTTKGPEPKDFVGNEFLLWLWYEADHRNGIIKTEAGDVTIFIDKSLDLDCAYGITGRDSLRSDGPTRMSEARAALRSGKVPRKCGMVLNSGGQYTFGFGAEQLSFASAILPEVEEAENPRVLFEERVSQLRDLCKTLDAIFDAFLKVRASASWESQVSNIRRWITTSGKPVAAVA